MRRRLGRFAPPNREGRSALAREGVVDVLSRASWRADRVTQLLCGEPVRELRRRAGWSRLRLADGYAGWCRSAALCPPEARAAGPRVRVAAWLTWARRAPSRRSPVVMELVAATSLRPGRRRGAWCEVHLPGNRTGWVPAADLARVPRAPAAPTRRAVVRRARAYLGAPYAWGGTTAKGFDCSGFVQRVFRECGLLLPRDAWQQEAVARRRAAARPGDLVFFGPPRGRAVHVGIVSGPGRVIHAGSPVREDSLLRGSPGGSPALARQLRGAGSVLR